MHGVALAIATALTDDTTDTALAARAADGDDAAFERILRRHNRLLFRTARSMNTVRNAAGSASMHTSIKARTSDRIAD